MQRFAGMVAMGVGSVAGLLGLLFLIGSAGRASRLAVAGVALVIAAVLVSVGWRWVQSAYRRSSSVVVPEVLELARRGSGAVTEAQIAAALGDRAMIGLRWVRQMVRSGDCHQQTRGGVTAYVFPELETRWAVRQCRYCGTQIPLGTGGDRCPSCGGALDPEYAPIPKGGSADYGMDDP